MEAGSVHDMIGDLYGGRPWRKATAKTRTTCHFRPNASATRGRILEIVSNAAGRLTRYAQVSWGTWRGFWPRPDAAACLLPRSGIHGGCGRWRGADNLRLRPYAFTRPGLEDGSQYSCRGFANTMGRPDDERWAFAPPLVLRKRSIQEGAMPHFPLYS